MSERTNFHAWITKYALTNGIEEIEVEDCFNISPTMVAMVNPPKYSRPIYHAGDWHRTREEAVAKAEKMRVAKIASLKKQIAKLGKLSFGDANDRAHDRRTTAATER